MHIPSGLESVQRDRDSTFEKGDEHNIPGLLFYIDLLKNQPPTWGRVLRDILALALLRGRR
jgi:hypothetical protein